MDEVSSKGTLTAEDIKELKLHLYDSVQNLKLSGLNDEEAFQVAKIRLGNKDALILEYEKVNGRSIVNKEWILYIYWHWIINYSQQSSAIHTNINWIL